MGSTYATDLNEAVEQGSLNLDVALYVHLTTNHYPPVPSGFVGLAKRAIEQANLGEWDAVLECDEGSTINGATTIEVRELIELMHLEYFLDLEEF